MRVRLILLALPGILCLEPMSYADPVDAHLQGLLTLMQPFLDPSHGRKPASFDQDVAPPISDENGSPKPDDWKRGIQLPKLLTEGLDTPQAICEDARRENLKAGTNKKFALIAYKSHFCDGAARNCLFTTRTISDPCNKFLRNNFQLYHARTYFHGNATPGTATLQKYFGGAGPVLIVLDLESCELVRKNPDLPLGSLEDDDPKTSNILILPNNLGNLMQSNRPGESDGDALKRVVSEFGSAADRFSAWKAQLLSLPGVREKISKSQQALSGKDLDCTPEERKEIPELGNGSKRVGDRAVFEIDRLRGVMDAQCRQDPKCREFFEHLPPR